MNSNYHLTLVAVGDIDAFIKTTRPDEKDEVRKCVNEAKSKPTHFLIVSP